MCSDNGAYGHEQDERANRPHCAINLMTHKEQQDRRRDSSVNCQKQKRLKHRHCDGKACRSNALRRYYQSRLDWYVPIQKCYCPNIFMSGWQNPEEEQLQESHDVGTSLSQDVRRKANMVIKAGLATRLTKGANERGYLPSTIMSEAASQSRIEGHRA